MYTKAKYVNDPVTGTPVCIQVEIDGVLSFVPLDPNNSDYQRIMAQNIDIAPAPPVPGGAP